MGGSSASGDVTACRVLAAERPSESNASVTSDTRRAESAAQNPRLVNALAAFIAVETNPALVNSPASPALLAARNTVISVCKAYGVNVLT
jgi:hypothetical protein